MTAQAVFGLRPNIAGVHTVTVTVEDNWRIDGGIRCSNNYYRRGSYYYQYDGWQKSLSWHRGNYQRRCNGPLTQVILYRMNGVT